MQPTPAPGNPGNLETPGNPETPGDPGSQAAYAGGRAAWLVGVLGVIEVAALGPVLALCVMLIWPSDSFRAQAQRRLTPDQWAWARQAAPLTAGLVAVLGLGPGLAFVGLAPGVRNRRRAAVLAARILLLVQVVELLWLAVQRAPSAAQSLKDGLPVHVTVNVLAVGTPMALVGYTFWRLAQVGGPSGRREA